ncbi:MAG: penicillin-binding protein 1C [Betaproteobacteria bacterium]|nr:penicillin-binding protein 1C [Betaproteobacteria bacterium]
MRFEWRKVIRRWWPLLLALAALLVLDRLFPPPEPDAKRHAVVVLARDGTPLRAFPDRDHLWRHPVSLEEVSPHYLEALVGYEDRWFWFHPGVNPFALARAAWQRMWHGRIVSGGSTLTMQVARIIEPIPRTIGGKLHQCVRALQLELRYSKRELLRLYVNQAPMGGVIEGVEAASRAYLGKSARRLTDAEAALLAVLPQAPSALRPDRHPDKARAARDKVLRRISAHWGEARIRDAMMEPAYAAPIRYPMLAPLLAERMRREAGGQARIATTIDAAIQSTLEQRLADRALTLPARVSLAALVIDNASLQVLAYAGSADFNDPERFSHVDMVQATRSPGSALKPFLYAFALDEGLIHSESLLADVPQSFSGYQPGNFQQSFHGPVSVSEALVRSLNVPAVEVLDRLGPARFVSQLRRGGLALDFPRDAEPNLSVILGGAGVTLEQLTAAYTAFARRGLAGEPRYTRSQPLREARMMSEGAAFIVRDMLESGSSIDRSFHTSNAAQHRIAWKTGTSFGFRDAWAVGVTDRYTVGVWVGRPDGTPNPGHFGANTATPLLLDVFAALPESPASGKRPPASVTRAPICWPLGLRRSATLEALCHVQRTAWLLHAAAPPTFPDRVRPVEPRYAYYVTSADGMRAEPDCARSEVHRVQAARWPALLEPWLDPALRRGALPPPWHPECRRQTHAATALAIVGAADGEVLHRAGAAPLVRLELLGPRDPVNWMVNGTLVARTSPGQGYAHRFTEPGRYEITAFDDSGMYDRISLSVR